MEMDVNGIDYDLLKSLFEVGTESNSPATEEGTETSSESTGEQGSTESTNTEQNVEQTKAFAKRLHEKSEQVRNEERESIAKSLGYESYAAMMKSREDKLLEEKGLNTEEVKETVEQLVQQKIENDPRIKELEGIRAQRAKEFAERELTELAKLTDGEIKSFNQIPKDVVDEWTKTGSLKGAYLKLHGEELIAKARGRQSEGSTGHMNVPSGGSPGNSAKRSLTQEEKDMYKFFNPSMTDEELNKKMVDK